MTQIKDWLASEDYIHNVERVFYDVIYKIFVVDLWIILKLKGILRVILKLLYPLLQITCFMILGASLLLIYLFTRVESDMLIYDKEYKYGRSLKEPILGITDNSAPDVSILEKELNRLKEKTHLLDTSLRRMNIQLKSFYARQMTEDKELPDFASETAGGWIAATPDTESYYEPTQTQLTLFGIPIWKTNSNPNYFSSRKVIQPWTQAGECWAFRGSHGKIEIELAYTIVLTHVTIEHIPVTLSLTGVINSAPKEFAVIGKFRNKYITIDTFVYSLDGLPSQTFPIKTTTLKKVPFKRIILEVLSNWGNSEYTCIYRFKVHGKIFEIDHFPSYSKRNN